jgi:hypothetical protein
MEYMRYYSVNIRGVGVHSVFAYSMWHAIDKAYTIYSHIQPNRKLYKIKRNGNKSIS